MRLIAASLYACAAVAAGVHWLLHGRLTCDMSEVPVLSCGLDDVLRSLMLQVNTEIVNCQKVVSQAGRRQLQQMLQNHVSATGSRLGQSLLDSWEVSDELGCALRM